MTAGMVSKYRAIYNRNLLYVEKGADPEVADGSFEFPFDTIQKAADAVYIRGNASSTNQYTIRAGAGIFYETVYLRSPYTHLIGAGAGVTIISASGGVCLWWTNATVASCQQITTDGNATLSGLDANYASLVADSRIASMAGGSVSSLSLDNGNSTTVPALVRLGVGDGYETVVVDSTYRYLFVYGSVYVRNDLLQRARNLHVTRNLTVRNVRVFAPQYSRVEGTFTPDFDAAEPSPAAPYDTLGYTPALHCYFGNLTTEGAARLDVRHVVVFGATTVKDTSNITGALFNTATLVVDGSPTVAMYGPVVSSTTSLTNPGTPNVTLLGGALRGAVNIAAGGTKTISFEGVQVIGAVTDPDGAIVYTGSVLGGGGGGGSSSVSLDFTSQATADLKAGGDGDYAVGDFTFAATNVVAAQAVAFTNGTGLVVQAASNQRLLPSDDITLAPQLRISLATLLNSLVIDEANGLRLWCRLEASAFASVAETCGFGLVSSGASPARFVAISKRIDGLYLDHHGPDSDAAISLLQASTTPDVLVLEKPPGLDLWAVRVGPWSSGWPAISDTTLIGSVALSVATTTLRTALTKYAELDLVLYNSNVSPDVPDYLHSLSTGDRSSSISVTTSFTMTGSGGVETYVDGDTTTVGQTAFSATVAAAGGYLKFDFGSRYVVNAARFKGTSGSPNYGTWRWQGSNNDSDWDDLSADFLWSPQASFTVHGDMSANAEAYRYYRMLGISGNVNSYGWHFEWEFSMADVSVADLVATFKNLKAESF